LKNCHTTGINVNHFGLGQSYFANDIRLHFISPFIFESVDYELRNEEEVEEIQQEEIYEEDH